MRRELHWFIEPLTSKDGHLAGLLGIALTAVHQL
jgi:hypothetical protein